MSDVIVLLKNFALVMGSGDDFETDWTSVPAVYQNWQLVYVVKTLASGTATATLQTSWDTTLPEDVSAVHTLSGLGTDPFNLSSGVGPMVRLAFASAGGCSMIISVYLTPKST